MSTEILHGTKCCEAWAAGKWPDDPTCPRCRLNKAAPQLLEACKGALPILKSDPQYLGYADCDCGGCTTIYKIEAAIAAATGVSGAVCTANNTAEAAHEPGDLPRWRIEPAS